VITIVFVTLRWLGRKAEEAAPERIFLIMRTGRGPSTHDFFLSDKISGLVGRGWREKS